MVKLADHERRDQKLFNNRDDDEHGVFDKGVGVEEGFLALDFDQNLTMCEKNCKK